MEWNEDWVKDIRGILSKYEFGYDVDIPKWKLEFMLREINRFQMENRELRLFKETERRVVNQLFQDIEDANDPIT